MLKVDDGVLWVGDEAVVNVCFGRAVFEVRRAQKIQTTVIPSVFGKFEKIGEIRLPSCRPGHRG
jgi:hypothetical protein